MKKDKLVERVKNLMAMAADGSSPNEAMIAARRARKLMDEHQLTIADLTDRSEFSSKSVSKARRFTPQWESCISATVAIFNDCIARFELAYDGKGGYARQIVFKGYDEDVKVAEYMYFYLIENGKRTCSKYLKDKGFSRYNAKLGTAFKNAYMVEINSKMNKMISDRKSAAADGKGLMVIKCDMVAQEFGAANYGTGKIKYRSDAESVAAAAHGQDAGINTAIYTGID